MTQLIRWDTTARGHSVGYFTDHLETRCSIQKSSLTGETCVWLGLDQPRGARMHLTRAMAKEIATALLRFAEAGEPSEGEKQ
jgi:hypothetical protein